MRKKEQIQKYSLLLYTFMTLIITEVIVRSKDNIAVIIMLVVICHNL